MYSRDEFNQHLLDKAQSYVVHAANADQDPDTQLVELVGRARSHQQHGELADLDRTVDQLYRVLVTRYVDADQLPEAPGRLAAPAPADTRSLTDQIVGQAEGLEEELSLLLNRYAHAGVLEDAGAQADAVEEMRALLNSLHYAFPPVPDSAAICTDRCDLHKQPVEDPNLSH